jgi:Zn-dependent M28 family amino/carboxypeptidase
VLAQAGHPRLRRLAPLVAACLLAAACSPAPSAAPSSVTSPGPTAPELTAGPTNPSASVTPLAPIAFAAALRDAIDIDAISADLDRLQAIADGHGGTRAAGSDGHAASARFVADQLRTAGFDVELQQVELPVFRQTAPSTLEITGASAIAYEDVHDFKAMLFSASGDVTAPIFALGYNPAAAPGDTGGFGCESGDWAGVPSGVIVLVQPANCRRHDVIVQAEAVGAVGIITAYPAWARDAVLRPTLIEPADIHIPAIGVTGAVGNALDVAANAGSEVHLATHTSSDMGSSPNVIAETPWGDPAHVVMLGGHLDSVIDGPGINDNGSGTMTVLAIARGLAELHRSGSPTGQAWKVRVAFWTGEEIGLWGSRAYAQDIPDRESLEAYLNFDMVGSANGVRDVYDGAASSRAAEGLVITRLFTRALDEAGLSWQTIPLGGSSDHFSFDLAGIPTGGLFSGANEVKTADQAALFGGDADVAEDVCYHLACDSSSHIDATLLAQLAHAAAWTAGALASGEVDLNSP